MTSRRWLAEHDSGSRDTTAACRGWCKPDAPGIAPVVTCLQRTPGVKKPQGDSRANSFFMVSRVHPRRDIAEMASRTRLREPRHLIRSALGLQAANEAAPEIGGPSFERARHGVAGRPLARRSVERSPAPSGSPRARRRNAAPKAPSPPRAREARSGNTPRQSGAGAVTPRHRPHAAAGRTKSS